MPLFTLKYEVKLKDGLILLLSSRFWVRFPAAFLLVAGLHKHLFASTLNKPRWSKLVHSPVASLVALVYFGT